MKKGKIKNILRNLMLSLIVIIPSIVFATDKKGDVINPTHFESTAESCTSISCELPDNKGDIAFEKTVSKTETEGIYEITLKVKGEDVTKTVEGNTHDIYIAVVLDISGSMIMPSKTKYENAVEGAKYFSEKVLEKNNKAELSLITFDKNVKLAREFDNETFSDDDFPSTGSGTNLKDAIDEATDLLKNKDSENAELYMVVIGDGLPNDVSGAISKAETAKKTDIEIFSIGYMLDNNGKDCLKKVAGFEQSSKTYNAYDDIAKENFVEANVDTILRKFDKIANKITQTFSAGTNVTITDVIGDNFTYVENSAKLEYTYNGKDHSSSIDPKTLPTSTNNNTIEFYLDEVMEITQTIKFNVKINKNTLDDYNETNKSANVNYTDHNGNKDQNITIEDSAEVYWTQPTYTINYCIDDNDHCFKTDKGTSFVDSIVNANVNENMPEGYKFKGGNTSITIKETGNVLDIIYVKDLSQKKGLSYTVKYYIDGKEVTNDKIVETDEVWVGEDDYITVKSFDTSNDRYKGYKFDSTDPKKIPESVKSGTTIKVYYVKDTNQTKPVNYTVKYFIDEVEVVEDRDVVTKNIWVNDPEVITVDEIDIRNNKYTGYKFDKTDPATIPSSVNSGSVINVYYIKDATQTKPVNYTVKYFTDGIEVVGDRDVVTKNIWVNDPEVITVDEIDTRNNKYKGYKFDKTDPATIPSSVNSGSVISVYYIKDTNQTKPVNYTLKYYTINGEEITERNSYNITDSVWINDSNNITVKPIDKSDDRYTGYKYGYTNPESIPTSIPSGSTIKVYYVKDITKTKELTYTIEYYKDNVLSDTKTDKEVVWVNDSNYIDVDFDLINTTDKYYGYMFNNSEPVTIPESVMDKATIKIYYVKDERVTKELSYTVKYFTINDGVETERHSYNVTENVWVHASDYITVKPIDKSNDRYIGYKYGYTNPESIPTSILNGSTINVYYVKDITKTKELTYTIKFYTDNIEVEEDRIINNKIVWINEPDTIDVKEFDMSDDKYTGYKLITNKDSIPTSVDTGTIINIHYEKDESQTKELKYTIKYFKDEVEVEEDEIIVTKEVWINDIEELEVDFDLINTTDKYTGYSFESINPEDLEETIKTESVIEIYYVINYYEYEVNYYKDSISEDNLIDSIEKKAKYKEVIEIDELLKLPKGYTYNGEEVELIIDVENNVINIVYEKDSFEYTVEYYYDGKLDEEKTDVISALYGTEITEVEDKSYDNYLLSKIENLPLVIDTKDNIIKVYYVESGIGGDIIDPPKTGNINYLNMLLVLISLIIIKVKF